MHLDLHNRPAQCYVAWGQLRLMFDVKCINGASPLFVEGCVTGVAYLDNKLYVVYRLLNTIHVFAADLYTELKVIKVRGLRFPLDIVVSHSGDHQLYVADSGNSASEECIWGDGSCARGKQLLHVLQWSGCICSQRAAAPRAPTELLSVLQGSSCSIQVLLWSRCACSLKDLFCLSCCMCST